MSRSPTLGLCPICDARIPRTGLLVEYEREGTATTITECPECREIVAPRLVTVPSLGPA